PDLRNWPGQRIKHTDFYRLLRLRAHCAGKKCQAGNGESPSLHCLYSHPTLDVAVDWSVFCNRPSITQTVSEMSRDLIIQAAVSGLLMGLIYALVAVGLSLIFGLMEIVNFAHGEFLMLAMFAAFWFWALAGLDPLLSLPLVAAILALAGAL